LTRLRPAGAVHQLDGIGIVPTEFDDVDLVFLEAAQEVMTCAASAPSRTGYSKLAPAKIACASGEIMNSRNLIALSLLGA
jgi:hypothetical protein